MLTVMTPTVPVTLEELTKKSVLYVKPATVAPLVPVKVMVMSYCPFAKASCVSATSKPGCGTL